MGIRIDAANAHAGAVISPYYDSLMAKVISRASTHSAAINKMIRALTEFRIRGVKVSLIKRPKLTSCRHYSNIEHLIALGDFTICNVTIRFEENSILSLNSLLCFRRIFRFY